MNNRTGVLESGSGDRAPAGDNPEVWAWWRALVKPIYLAMHDKGIRRLKVERTEGHKVKFELVPEEGYFANSDAGWLSIETAPKGGVRVDLWFGKVKFPHRVTDAFWGRPSHDCGEAGRYCDSCPSYDGWCNDLCGYLTGPEGCYSQEPTHWRHIPEGPNPNPPANAVTEEFSAADPA